MESTTPPQTPKRTPRRQEATTRKKAKFFEAINTRKQRGETIKDVCIARGLPHNTGKFWLKMRKAQGSPGTRRHGKWRSGRPSKVNQSTYDTLRAPTNPVRNRKMERQLQYHQILVDPRTIERNSDIYTKNAQMYKQRPAKQVSDKNAGERLAYGHRHKDHTIENFWSFVLWTDEKHWDAGFTQQGRIFRDAGTAESPENT